VWYCNLRNPVKATSLGHQRHIKARPQYKAFNIYKPEDWKMQVPPRKNKTLKLEKGIQRAFQANNSTIWGN
jgi:hypothetical protein